MMKLIVATILVLTRCFSATAMDMTGLPWSELDECYYPEFTQYPRYMRTNHNLIDQPSGLCMDHLFCGFQQCNPKPEILNGPNSKEYFDEVYTPFGGFGQVNISPEELDAEQGTSYAAALEKMLDPANPAYNLPSKVLFPRNAGDVVAAVDFCKTHGVEISVKNSGHNYVGASTKANTLMVNMNQYKRYASDDKETNGIVECNVNGANVNAGEATVSGPRPVDIDTELCRLVLARGKYAAIRVGGGENFDKTYRSLRDFNEREGYKYHIIGGAAGTVSPMGWKWQGGLGATTGGRMFGFGVDQVLQIEAVLPNGKHVRFGPTSWEDDEGYVYPRTTKVSGVCNENPGEEEVNWVWVACPEDTNALFDDLWFAFRGGGGGTWGIVLSVYLQLHKYMPLVKVTPSKECLATMYEPDDTSLLRLTAEFAIDYFLDPGALNTTRDQSNACGVEVGSRIGNFYCYSEDQDVGVKLLLLYQDFVSKNSERLTEEVAAIATKCLVATNYNSYAEFVTATEGPLAGKVPDTSKPAYSSDMSFLVNLLLPKSWILENKDELANYWIDYPTFLYFAFGGDAEFAHDQTASLSAAHRNGGVMVYYIPGAALDAMGEEVTVWERLLPEIYDFTSGSIPPYIGSNHLGPNTYGPLKDDPSTLCPVFNLTTLEAETMCISAQEAVYGTESLKRLESIKKAVDPNGMFDCFRCIGNTVVEGEDEEELVTKKTKSIKGKKTKSSKSKSKLRKS